ncbi:hypothetical protein [Mycobacterium celatum]|nr:hypothetical protein [Mycobacterium celatum]
MLGEIPGGVEHLDDGGHDGAAGPLIGDGHVLGAGVVETVEQVRE